MQEKRCLAIMYHYIGDRQGTAESGIRGLTIDQFERQLDRLCHDLEPIDWTRFYNWRAGRGDIPDHSFLLTFDDALADHAFVTRELLQPRDLCGVFFVHTAALEDGHLCSAHQVHQLLCRMNVEQLSEALQSQLDARVADWRQTFAVPVAEAARVYHYESPEIAVLKYLLSHVLPIDVRSDVVSSVFHSHVGESDSIAERWYLNWDQVREMQAAGHTIGGHSHRHEPYHRLTATEQARDLMQCSALLSQRLGPGSRPMSYPFGMCDEDIARRCAFAGFVNGFTTEPGWIEASQDAHRLSRVDTIHVDAFLEREFSCLSP